MNTFFRLKKSLLLGAIFFSAFSVVTINAEDEMENEAGQDLSYRFAPYEKDDRIANAQHIVDGERHLVVVVCSFNNAQYYKGNLNSILKQEYKNYHVLYVDDCSSDGTYGLVKKYIEDNDAEDKIILLRNKKRRKALANLYYAIHSCNPSDIVLILDGDDQFSTDQVMNRINTVYAEGDTWLTYGQFRMVPGGQIGFCQAYPRNIIDRNGFRYYPATPSHLRTFYAGLFHKISLDDLLFQGDFFPMTYDLAIMFPMIEMARTHHRFIPDVLVDYNSSNPINDHKVGKGLQRKFDLIIRARTVYKEIDSPF